MLRQNQISGGTGLRCSIFFLFMLSVTMLFAGCAAIGSEVKKSDTAGDGPDIRVQIVSQKPELMVIPNDTWTLGTKDNLFEYQGYGDTQINFMAGNNGSVLAHINEDVVDGKALIFNAAGNNRSFQLRSGPRGATHNEGTYEGKLVIYAGQDNTLEAVLTLPLEKYLLGVVPAEIGGGSPMEAMCAQAVAARSEAMSALVTGKYAGDHHDLCSTVMSQVFVGQERQTEETNESVRRTRGIIMMFEGEPVSAYYSAHCGGHTEDIRNVWFHRNDERSYWDAGTFDGEAAEYYSLDLTREEDFHKWVKSSPPSYCNPEYYTMPQWTHGNFRWKREVSAERLSARVARRKDIGRVTSIRPIRRGVSGRLIEVDFIGEKGTLRVGPELSIRQIFSPLLKSAAFVVETEGPEERPEQFIIRGAGRGHGVGMCQTGTMGMANDGKNFREIISNYYPHVTLEEVY